MGESSEASSKFNNGSQEADHSPDPPESQPGVDDAPHGVEYPGPGASPSADPMGGDPLSDEGVDTLCEVDASPRVDLPASHEHSLKKCSGCQQQLPWQTLRDGSEPSLVVCPGCGRWYCVEDGDDVAAHAATFVARSSAELRAPGEIKSVSHLLDHFVGVEGRKRETRRHFRHPVTLPVIGVPIDQDLRPAAPAQRLTLLDVSLGGACLLSTKSWDWTRVLLDFGLAGCAGRQLIADVRWGRCEYKLTRFGCEFLNSNEGETLCQQLVETERSPGRP